MDGRLPCGESRKDHGCYYTKWVSTSISILRISTGSNTMVRRADSLVEVKDGTTYFVEPHNEEMTMRELLERLTPGR